MVFFLRWYPMIGHLSGGGTTVDYGIARRRRHVVVVVASDDHFPQIIFSRHANTGRIAPNQFHMLLLLLLFAAGGIIIIIITARGGGGVIIIITE